MLQPDTLHHPDNFCYVDRHSTPAHIVPEWYFLSYYAMLRACPSKLIGVCILAGAIASYLLCLFSLGDVSSCRSTYSGAVSMSKDLFCLAIGYQQKNITYLHAFDL